MAYHRPASLEEALDLMRLDGSRALAGGTDLIPQLREGRRSARRIVDLKAIPQLLAIAEEQETGGMRIGASASCTAIARDPRISERYPAVAASLGLIGSLQIQSRASLGGNIANAAPSADAVPVAIALGAAVEIAGRGLRRVALETIFAGPGRTTLEPGELITAILLPAVPPRGAAAYLRHTPRREMDIAIAGAGVALRLDERHRIRDARVCLASVAPIPLLLARIGEVLDGEQPTAALLRAAGEVAARECRPISDTRGSADYRRTLVRVLVARALAAALMSLGHPLEVP